MDPPSLIRCPSPNAPSAAASGPSFGLTEIWPLDSANLLGIHARRGHFGQNLGFSESMGPVRDASAAEESTVTEQSGRLGGGGGGGGGRKRRDATAVAVSEDETPKLTSTSSGNDMVGEIDNSALVILQCYFCNFVGYLRLIRADLDRFCLDFV